VRVIEALVQAKQQTSMQRNVIRYNSR